MSVASKNGAAIGRLSAAVGGLGGLSGASSKKGKRSRRRAGSHGELNRVVNAFISGRAACGRPEFPQSKGYDLECQYETDGFALRVHGAKVAERVAATGSMSVLDATDRFAPMKLASKQIRICFRPPGTRSAPYDPRDLTYELRDGIASRLPKNKFYEDQIAAINALMGTVKSGVRVHELKDFVGGMRAVQSPFRIGPAIVGESCVVVEVTEEMRRRALSNFVMDKYTSEYQDLLSRTGFPQRKSYAKLSKQELNALAMQANLAMSAAASGGDVSAARAALARLITAMNSGRSFYGDRIK